MKKYFMCKYVLSNGNCFREYAKTREYINELVQWLYDNNHEVQIECMEVFVSAEQHKNYYNFIESACL